MSFFCVKSWFGNFSIACVLSRKAGNIARECYRFMGRETSAHIRHFRNENMADFRKNSEAYRRLVREEEEAYAKLDTLNLTEEQREIIEEAFEAQSAAEAEYATESYFCGIADCIRFLKYIEGPRGE